MDNNLYYRPGGRTTKRRSFRSRKKKLKYLYPLLLIVAIVLIIYLLFSFFKFLTNLNSGKFDNAATVYVVSGRAQMQSFREDEFIPVVSGQLLLEGDRIQTFDNSRVVLQFFNDTFVRLNEGTDLYIDELNNGKNEDTINLSVNAGEVWLNKPEPAKPKSVLAVKTNYLIVRTTGTVFNVRSGLPEAVQVVNGNVLVEVVENQEESGSLDKIPVGVGQELVLDNQALDTFKRRETPSVLGAVTDEFENSQWYLWNTQEDTSPTEFEVDPALLDSETGTVIESEEPIEIDPIEFEEMIEAKLPAPEVTTPAEGETLSADIIHIEGTTVSETEKIMVTSFEDGIPNPYVLTAYEPGDRTWRYIAAFEGGEGNLVVGENKFEVIAIDENGDESEKTTLVFNYIPESGSVSAPDELTAPSIDTINDETVGEKFILTEDRGVIVGSVGKWAEKLVINDYTLQQFTPYSGEFSYILSEEFGTLGEGDNVLEIYAIDSEGNKSPVASYTITYVP